MKTLLSATALLSLLLTSCSKDLKPIPNMQEERLSAKPATQKEDPLRKFAEDAQGSFACGLYLDGKKVGYLIGSSEIVKRGDTDFFEQKIETFFSAKKQGKTFTDKSTLTRLFNLDDNGQLTSIQQVNERDAETYTSSVLKQGDKYLESSSGGKSSRSIIVEPPRTSLDNDKQLGDWLRSSPKAGDQFDYKSSDFAGGEFKEHTSHYKYIASKKLVINGVLTTIHSLEQKDDRDEETTNYECDNKGRLIHGNIGPITFRLEDEATARKLGTTGIDLIEASSVPANVRMGDPRKLKQVLLKISGLKYSLPNSHRQMQTADSKGGTTLMVLRDFIVPDKELLDKVHRQEYLKATPAIQSDSSEIKAFAAKAVGNQTDPIKQSELLQKAVYNLIAKDVNRNSNTALEVLERKAGDCTEHALLFNALVRARGIPCREVTGLMYTQAPEPRYYWHVWNEIYDGERWISVDPTWDEVLVDAGHLKIANDDTVKIANSFGRIKIEITSFQTDDSIATEGAFVSPEKREAKESDLVLMDRLTPPPAALHAHLKEAPAAVNIEPRPLSAKPKPARKDLGQPIQQFNGSRLNEVQFDKQGHLVE